jgi:hypothetical protein
MTFIQRQIVRDNEKLMAETFLDNDSRESLGAAEDN